MHQHQHQHQQQQQPWQQSRQSCCSGVRNCSNCSIRPNPSYQCTFASSDDGNELPLQRQQLRQQQRDDLPRTRAAGEVNSALTNDSRRTRATSADQSQRTRARTRGTDEVDGASTNDSRRTRPRTRSQANGNTRSFPPRRTAGRRTFESAFCKLTFVFCARNCLCRSSTESIVASNPSFWYLFFDRRVNMLQLQAQTDRGRGR